MNITFTTAIASFTYLAASSHAFTHLQSGYFLIDNVEAWLKYLRNELPTIAFKASTQSQNSNLSRSNIAISKASQALLETSTCLGADVLLKLLANYSRNRDLKTAIRVGVVG